MERSVADAGFCECCSLWFQVSGGSIIEDIQFVSVCALLNDVTPGVIAETTPRVAVVIKVSCDYYVSSYTSDEAWKILGFKVIGAVPIRRNTRGTPDSEEHPLLLTLHLSNALNVTYVRENRSFRVNYENQQYLRC